jgi:hypothetical protein
MTASAGHMNQREGKQPDTSDSSKSFMALIEYLTGSPIISLRLFYALLTRRSS